MRRLEREVKSNQPSKTGMNFLAVLQMWMLIPRGNGMKWVCVCVLLFGFENH